MAGSIPEKTFDLESLLARPFQRIGTITLASKLLATGGLVLGLCFGATVARSQRQPETFFKTKIGLSESDIQKMEQGHVVTRVLDSPDKKYGVLAFGGVYINASIERFAASYRDVKALLEDKVYRDVQEFNAAGPPTLSDFNRLSFERKDIDTIQNCKPRHCDIQVFDVASFQKQINWNSKERYDQFNKLARLRICEGLSKYMAGGLQALGSYTDHEKPFHVTRAQRLAWHGSAREQPQPREPCSRATRSDSCERCNVSKRFFAADIRERGLWQFSLAPRPG